VTDAEGVRQSINRYVGAPMIPDDGYAFVKPLDHCEWRRLFDEQDMPEHVVTVLKELGYWE